MKTLTLYTFLFLMTFMIACNSGRSGADGGAESDIHTNTSSTSDMQGAGSQKSGATDSNSRIHNDTGHTKGTTTGP